MRHHWSVLHVYISSRFCLILIVVTLSVVSLISTAVHAHDPESHIRDLTEQLARTPNQSGLFAGRGEHYRALQQWDNAAADFEASLRLEPERRNALLGLARTRLDMGCPVQAISESERLLSLDADLVPAWRIYAQALEQQGFEEEAVFAYAQFLDHATDSNPDDFLRQATLLGEFGACHWSKALACLNEGCKRLNYPVALELKALEYERALGRTDQALRRVDRLVAAARRTERWHLLRGQVLAEAGRCDEARDAFRAAQNAVLSLPHRIRARPAIWELLDEIEGELGDLDAAQGTEIGIRQEDEAAS